YTAGVVLSFLLLGALMLGLRSAGEAVGWGFQLQSPAVVASLAALFTLIGLNLAGVFEFGRMLPSSLAGLQARHPVLDAFLTGVLAVAVASPCTAPFMGASLGLTATLPAGQALSIFAALGLGLALPYLLASWLPAFARALPRPGAWMDTLRRLLAFPMFATVVWLVWVLGQQSGINGAAALLALLVALSMAVWALTLRGATRAVLAPLSIAACAWLVWLWGPNIIELESTPMAAASAPSGVAGVTSWQPWRPGLADELVAQGRPVFVDYTAAWCVTCQYNKNTTLASAAVLQDFATKNVALLRADWTRRDPAITAALAQLGRSGVPVYVLHAPGKAPVVFSEILGESELRAAMSAL
ncbi:protein-disulfide reductase DsbD family protein, partial [Diaphorobacter nitroreducens]